MKLIKILEDENMEECFACDKKTDKGKYISLDKRSSGDGLFGSTWFCNKCLEEN